MNRRVRLFLLLAFLCAILLPFLGNLARELWQRGLNNALVEAVDAHNATRVKVLLAKGADPRTDVGDPWQWWGPIDWNPPICCDSTGEPMDLHFPVLNLAAAHGDTAIVKLLLDAGADIYDTSLGSDCQKTTPLELARIFNHRETERFLMERPSMR
jgi:hypothetical protein